MLGISRFQSQLTGFPMHRLEEVEVSALYPRIRKVALNRRRPRRRLVVHSDRLKSYHTGTHQDATTGDSEPPGGSGDVLRTTWTFKQPTVRPDTSRSQAPEDVQGQAAEQNRPQRVRRPPRRFDDYVRQLKHMPDYTAVVSVPPILDFEIVGRPSLSVFTLTHCTGSRKRNVEGVDCSGLERRCTSLVTPCRSSQRRNAASNGSQKPLNCRTSPMLSCRTRRSYLSSSSTRRCMTRNLVTSLSNSTIVSDLSSSEMPSSRSCCELKKGCFVRYKALDTSRIASVSVTLVHQCVHVIISESYVAVAGSNPAQKTKNMLENPSNGT
ncbi:hypothetical protein T02_810 [Trichinella nativa]|uniref:Uncharacterized protein n=1 Tax=Trichinella nativa TaxID=6335 RepID=A0A0V1KV23_9BILA|nr:hypothetical protein T02_810 [Trichinella nativa]